MDLFQFDDSKSLYWKWLDITLSIHWKMAGFSVWLFDFEKTAFHFRQVVFVRLWKEKTKTPNSQTTWEFLMATLGSPGLKVKLLVGYSKELRE